MDVLHDIQSTLKSLVASQGESSAVKEEGSTHLRSMAWIRYKFLLKMQMLMGGMSLTSSSIRLICGSANKKKVANPLFLLQYSLVKILFGKSKLMLFHFTQLEFIHVGTMMVYNVIRTCHVVSKWRASFVNDKRNHGCFIACKIMAVQHCDAPYSENKSSQELVR